MNDSPWFIKHKNILRQVALALLIISLLGPWGYDRIHVPAEYTCSLPNIRLYGDFCGMPMSWLSGFLLFAGAFFHILWQLITGTFTGRGGELLGVFLLALPIALPILPLFSFLLLLKKKAPSRLRGFHLIAWGLGCIFPVFIIAFQPNIPILLLWGPWLYFLAAVGAVVVEIFITKTSPAGLSE